MSEEQRDQLDDEHDITDVDPPMDDDAEDEGGDAPADGEAEETAEAAAEPVEATVEEVPRVDPVVEGLKIKIERLESERTRLRRKLDEATNTVIEIKAAYKDARADFAASQERGRRDRDRQVNQATGSVIKKLLDVLDNLDRSIAASERNKDLEALLQGMHMVRDGFRGRLEEIGLEKVETDNQAFDANIAEAVALIPIQDPEMDGKVLATEVPAYRFRGQILRPGRVIVGQLPS